MTEPTRGLAGLRAAARDTLFRDWHVTPETRARLARRLQELEQTGVWPEAAAPVRRQPRRWLRPAAWGAAATALVLAGALLGQPGMGLKEEKAAEPPAGAHIAAPERLSAPQGNQSTDQFGLRSGDSDFAVGVVTLDSLHKPGAEAAAFSVTVTDQNGVKISGIPGVEVQPGRKVILNADLALEVASAQEAVQGLRALADRSGGYVADAALDRDAAGGWAGRMVLRIPATAYGSAMQEIERLGEVTFQRQWSEDVTDQYTDLETRIGIAEQFEQRLTELAGTAATFKDWIEVERQANETRAEIEHMRGALKRMANQVDYSTIAVTVTQPAPGQPTRSRSLTSQAGESFLASVQGLLGWGWRVVVGLAGLAPFLLLAAAAGGVAALLLRRRPGRGPALPPGPGGADGGQ